MTNGDVGIILSADVGDALKPKAIMVFGVDKTLPQERIINLANAPQDDQGELYQPSGVFAVGAWVLTSVIIAIKAFALRALNAVLITEC